MVVGGWVDGLFVVGQRPGRAGRIAKMPALAGKRAVVFLTYALDPGKALQKLSDAVAAAGADVLGGVRPSAATSSTPAWPTSSTGSSRSSPGLSRVSRPLSRSRGRRR